MCYKTGCIEAFITGSQKSFVYEIFAGSLPAEEKDNFSSPEI